MTLDELDAAYAAMTPGELSLDDDGQAAYVLDDEGEPVWVMMVQGDKRLNHLADAAGFVALHNHYPAVRGLLRRAVELLRPFAINRDCHEIRTFLAECDKPLTEAK